MQVVGILGGMGPAAGADFVRLFVAACAAHLQALGWPVNDQAFPEHWLAQVPLPDRSQALEPGAGADAQPLAAMLQVLGRLVALGVRSVAMPCNTAHAWHGQLQERFPQIELLHMPGEVARELTRQRVHAAAVMATTGTYQSAVYAHALAQAGVTCHLPSVAERETIMRGIYQGVKAGDMALARRCFAEVAQALAERYPGAALVLGCTEIPLALGAGEQGGEKGHAGDMGWAVPGLVMVNPTALLAQALARRAYATLTTED